MKLKDLKRIWNGTSITLEFVTYDDPNCDELYADLHNEPWMNMDLKNPRWDKYDECEVKSIYKVSYFGTESNIAMVNIPYVMKHIWERETEI